MKIVQPNCRVQFTPEDFAWLRQALDGGKGLEQLMREDDTLADILDDPGLIQAIQDNPNRLKISTHLYFYLLTRKVLREVRLLNRKVAEYVAELLVHFADARHLNLKAGGQPPSAYFCDLLLALHQADAHTAFRIQAFMGDYALFLVGLFPERIQHQATRKGAPSVRYYAGMGVSSYQAASNHTLASQYAVAEVFSELAENFELVCRALHDLAERYLFLAK